MNTITKRKPLVWLLVLVVVCVAPFANKAYHIDDTLFLRAARQIQEHPGDFYGCSFNWFGTPLPLIKEFINPPLNCYYIALAASVSGWSEAAIHLAFLLPALASVAGTYLLARKFSNRPIWATLTAVLTPVFLISSTTVMCDVMHLAFWVWAIVLFDKGLDENKPGDLIGSGILTGMALLTKFTGLGLVPLLLAYGLARRKKPGWWLASLLIPVIFAAGYELITHRLYGEGMLFSATAFAAKDRVAVQGGFGEKAVMGLVFMGGCFLPILFQAPLLWSKRIVPLVIGLIAASLVIPASLQHFTPLLLRDGRLDWGMVVQTAVFVLGGMNLVFLAGADFWKRRDPVSLLLVLWMMGIFIFATALNWTINGRSLLPMMPAVGILVARRMDRRFPNSEPEDFWRLLVRALPAAALSLLLVKADYDIAGAHRKAADEICAKYAKPGRTVWFEGHWGFQYYMEKHGGTALDLHTPKLPSGDLLVLPSNGSNVFPAPLHLVHLIDILEFFPSPYYTTENSSVGAGFYGAVLGPLPFAIGDVASERFYVFQVN